MPTLQDTNHQRLYASPGRQMPSLSARAMDPLTSSSFRRRRGNSIGNHPLHPDISLDDEASHNLDADVLDVHSADMRRAAKELLSETHLRPRGSFVGFGYQSAGTLPDSEYSGSQEDPEHGGESNEFIGKDEQKQGNTLLDHTVSAAPFGYGSIGHNETLSLNAAARKPQASTSVLSFLIQQMSSVAVVALLNLMVAIPFGASYFPIGWRAVGGNTADADADADEVQGTFPLPGKQALGIRMFLFATMMGQLAFTFASKFENPVGMQMVENVPFLHALCYTAIRNQGYGVDALSTVMFLFGMSSIFVGITFYLLGKWQLGRLVYYFPNHVLVGCIGGIGIFIAVTAIEVMTDETFTFTLQSLQVVYEKRNLLSVVIGFETTLRLLQHLTMDKAGNAKYPLLAPIFYCSITPLFYLGLWIFGITIDQATEQGSFFPAIGGGGDSIPLWKDPHLWDIFRAVDFSKISFFTVLQSSGTMFALVAFSLIHVPINIPAFAISTDVDADMNAELIAHGYANTLSGLFGGLQTYMSYSTSVLYAKSGGRGKVSSIAVVVLTMVLFVVGPSIASYLPRCMAGTLLLHIGVDLVLEGLFDSIGSYDNLEYAGIWAITIVMTIWGMTAALVAGVIAALTTYAVQSINYQNPIRQIMTASTLRSSAWTRPAASRAILENDTTGRARILIFQLQGHLFFGNVAQLTDAIKILLKEKKELGESPIVVIVDFTLVVGMDSSAAHAVAKLKKVIHRLFHVENSIFVTGDGGGFPCEYALSEALAAEDVGHGKEGESDKDNLKGKRHRGGSHVCLSLDEALRLAEDTLIIRYDPRLTPAAEVFNFDGVSTVNMTLDEERFLAEKFLRELLPQTADLETNLKVLFGLLQREEYSYEQVLWEEGDDSDSMKLLILGELVSLISETGASEPVKRGNIVGELGLVHGTRRLTTLMCATDKAILYSLNQVKFNDLRKRKPQVAASIDGVVIRYLAHRVQLVSNRYFNEHLPV